MGWIITSIILGVVAYFALGINFKEETWGTNPKQLLSFLCLLLMIPAFLAKIPANNVGIKYSPFHGTSETTLSEGFHAKNPFDKIYKISTEVQTRSVDDLTTQTMDAQYVNTQLNIKYRVSSANAYLIFTQFRELDRMSDTLIVPTAQRVLELVTTKYNVMDVLGEKRGEIYAELERNMTEELAKYGVEFHSISITDMDAGEAIEAAITNEAVAKKAVETAQQELLKAEMDAKQQSVNAQAAQDAAKIQAETKKIQAEADAQIKTIQAQANADAKVIEAQAEKESVELLKGVLTKDILQMKWTERWNGILPTYYGGTGTDLLLGLNMTE